MACRKIMENSLDKIENWWQSLADFLTFSVLSSPITDPVPVFPVIIPIMLVS
jgi:hypothetical protein